VARGGLGLEPGQQRGRPRDTRAPRDDIAIIALRVSDRPTAEDRSPGAPPAAGLATPS
jgi:hypothetical protein